MTEQSFARGATWIVCAIFVAALVLSLLQHHVEEAILSSFVVIVTSSWASLLESLQRYTDAKAGKMLADRTISEITLKATDAAVRTGHYRIDARLERRRRAVN